jgi:hypothetical protein
MDRLDDLGPEAMERTCSQVQSFQADFKRLARNHDLDLHTAADLDMLQASCSGLLIELEQHRSWESNPLITLKIVFIGLDQALNKPCQNEEERSHRIRSRLDQARRVVNRACSSLALVPEGYHAAALEMIQDGRTYLSDISSNLDSKSPLVRGEDLAGLDQSLERFSRFLTGLDPVPDRHMVRHTLETTLREHFLDSRSLRELESLAADEFGSALSRLNALQGELNPRKTWQEIYQSLNPPGFGAMDTFSLYRRTIEDLQSFFAPSVFSVQPDEAPLKLVPTPTYLRSVRSSASFSAALTRGEPSFFFLSPEPPGGFERQADKARSRRLNREVAFLTAHETLPGHHLLDARRRSLGNPVRRQLESPLFYEGWATYAESLLRDRGFLQGPANELLEEKRRLWRAARCLIDLRRHSGAYDRDSAAQLLIQSGFSRNEALTQVDRFQLNPGYQICYTGGLLEFKRLKEAWGPKLGWDRFHELVLDLGELPFDRLERCLSQAAGSQ